MPLAFTQEDFLVSNLTDKCFALVLLRFLIFLAGVCVTCKMSLKNQKAQELREMVHFKTTTVP